jgi:hypothetical protein
MRKNEDPIQMIVIEAVETIEQQADMFYWSIFGTGSGKESLLAKGEESSIEKALQKIKEKLKYLAAPQAAQ